MNPQSKPLRVRIAPGLFKGPFSGRIVVFFGKPDTGEPRMGPNWFNPSPMWAINVTNINDGAIIELAGPAVDVFPRERKAPPVGTWMVQAVADRGFARSIGNGAGNGYSAAIKWNTTAAAPELVIDKVVQEPVFQASDGVEEFRIRSERISRFARSPVDLKCAIIKPKDWSQARKWAVVYEIPGFGGRHYGARRGTGPMDQIGVVRVVLDPDCPGGHHVFADSANNGPYGEALIKELIPAVERKVNALGTSAGRFVMGHSSGGWSSLWLQVRYPDVFGGVWSTAPDPVDFHDFQRINLYADDSMFTDSQGRLRPLARRGEEPVVWYRDFSDMEVPLGRGEQLGSFEAVFSRRDRSGQPERIWDRKTGKIDHKVAESWKPFDIRERLEKNWKSLGPKLAGKLHVYTGGLDTFYLEGAVVRLKDTLARLGSDAVIEVVPGKDHGSLMDSQMRKRIADEIGAAARKAGV